LTIDHCSKIGRVLALRHLARDDLAEQGKERVGDLVGVVQLAKVTGRQRPHRPPALRGGVPISGVGVAEVLA